VGDEAVRARVGAVRELGNGLGTYAKSLTTAVASARADLNRAGAEFQLAVADSQRALLAAERRAEMARMELARCQEGCGDLERQYAAARAAVQMAQKRHETSKKAQARFDRAAADLASVLRTTETSANELIPGGRKFIVDYGEILSSYLKTGIA
jgi:chromosome segregation ATPase